MLDRSIQEKTLVSGSFQDEERVLVMTRALLESAACHARALCELFANPEGKFPQDLELNDLLPDWDWGKPKYTVLNKLLSEFEEAYGHYFDATSPYRTLNQMFSHPTAEWASEHDYAAAVDTVLPSIHRILAELEALRP